MPLLMRLHIGEPSAADMAALLEAAVARFGTPRYLLSDRGSQFTARRFCRRLRRLGIRQRFAAVGAIGAVAIIEWIWKTL
jgi:transposase InsO family protein